MIDMSTSHPFTTQGFANEQAQRLLNIVRQNMSPGETRQVEQAYELAWSVCGESHGEKGLMLIEHALAIATILAEMRIDAVGVSAGLIFEALDADLVPLERVETVLGVATARVVGSMLRLNILERKKRAGAQFIPPDRAGGSNYTTGAEKAAHSRCPAPPASRNRAQNVLRHVGRPASRAAQTGIPSARHAPYHSQCLSR